MLGNITEPAVREVLVTITEGPDGEPQVGNLEATTIEGTSLAEAPYNQRPLGIMDFTG